MKRTALFIAVLCALSSSAMGTSSARADSSSPNSSLPRYVDLRNAFKQWGLPIKPQGRRDTCAVFTFTGALEFALARGTNQKGLRLSEEYLNWAADDITGIKFDGASYEDLISAFDKWGICAEKFLPYASRYNANTQPSQQALDSAKEIWQLGFKRHWIAQRTRNGLTDAHIAQMKKVVASGWPLCAYGRDHSILIVGYVEDPKNSDGPYFITRNSATQKYETIFFEAAKAEFGSVLWIEMPRRESSEVESGEAEN